MFQQIKRQTRDTLGRLSLLGGLGTPPECVGFPNEKRAAPRDLDPDEWMTVRPEEQQEEEMQ